MVKSAKAIQLNKYLNSVKNHKKLVSCRYCHQSFYAKPLEIHFFREHKHRFPSSDCCPWCEGGVSWGPREKTRHALHLSDCFKQYWTHYGCVAPPPPALPFQIPAVLPPPHHPWRLEAPERQFSGRSPFSYPHAYDLFFTLPANRADVVWYGRRGESNQLTFVDRNQRGVDYVRDFLEMEGSVRWYHLMVRACAFEAFYKAFSEYVDPADASKRHRAFLLEYSCWCDGVDSELDPEYRHHRHLIAVARDGAHFTKHCWQTITLSDPPHDGYRFKLRILIKTWQHLQNVLYYVAVRKRSCDFEIARPDQPMKCLDREGRSHYHIFTSVTPTFKLCVALSVEGGLQAMLTQLKGQCRVERFAPHAVLKSKGKRKKYAVEIRHVIDPQVDEALLHSVVPVTKEWIPTGAVDTQTSAAYLTLMDGQRMHFERRKVGTEGEEAWSRMQAERGNRFLEAVKDDWWFPSSTQQKILREVVPKWQEMERRTREWEGEKARYEKDLRDQKAECETRLEKQKAEYETRLEKEQKRYDHFVEFLLKQTDGKMKFIIDHYQGGDVNMLAPT